MEPAAPDKFARARLAMIAHDEKKADLVEFAIRHRQALQNFDIVATGTTGSRLKTACPDLSVTAMRSGPLGGDQQIGAMIAEGTINGLIFFIDPLTPMPHDVDVKALMRLAVVYDVAMALNEATAELLIVDPTRLSHPLPIKRREARSDGS
ncbi:MAG: methylglyoxal synthase [Hyphomicrobiales bacterium]